MDEAKRLYKVKGDKVISTKVIKETPKLYWINDINFSYSCQIRKEHAILTPTEAVKEEMNRALTQHGITKDRFEAAEKRLEIAQKLQRSVVRPSDQ